VAAGPILLTPREEDKEIYPYRRVWRTASIEILILLAMLFVTVVAVQILHISLGATEPRRN
jgi:hypothetical protein